ncbi:MAG: DUF4384 domain-containing protein [Myxococcales bacterium]|nr:DUF4384 domain-containing protein [Myxococcales bacterium]
MNGHAHLGELGLRRLFAGELPQEDADQARSCTHCRSRLRGIEEEQRRFESELPFERFAAGVERAARSPRPAPKPQRRWLYPFTAMAASCLLAVGSHALIDRLGHNGNRIKGSGGPEVDLVVSGAKGEPQRHVSAAAPEALSKGDRVRIGYRAGDLRYVAAVSVDEQGEVTALYPQAGPSLEVSSAEGMQYLPQSIEFTGHGAERVIVVLSPEPLEVEAVTRAAKEAFTRAGRVETMDTVELPGTEQFHRVVLKP